MPFVLLDDGFHSNRKVIRATLAGAGLFARALSYCSDELTDGWVPVEWALEVADRALCQKLEKVGLWVSATKGEVFTTLGRDRYSRDRGKRPDIHVTIPDEGYYILDYLALNPSRDDVLALRRERSESGKRGAERRWSDD